MKIINAHGLPAAFVNAVSHNYPPHPNRHSVTQITDHPHIKALRIKHWDEITVDVSERQWALVGKIMHRILCDYAPENAFAEEGREEEIHWNDDNVITWRSDLYQDGIIYDYKLTSVWSIKKWLHDETVDLEKQLNLYAWIWRYKKYPVKALKVVAMARDWRMGESLQGNEYPPQSCVIDIPMWPKAKTKAYLDHRMKLHLNYNGEPCDAESRWESPSWYAVMKEGNKNACKHGVLPTQEDAEKFIARKQEKDKKGVYTVEYRPGGSRRCENYCDVSFACNYYQENKP